jgi:radical SAM superfamily enzyme YgiQ (UPF0313 family)
VPDIVLTTLNARWAHASFGLRYLLANLGDLQPRAALLEFEIKQPIATVAQAILGQQPRIVGIGVYIWNATPAAELVAMLKRERPDLIVILGGPEVSHEIDEQPICAAADYVISGEADLAFADVCRKILNGSPPADRVIAAPLPDFRSIRLPYDFYDPTDIERRVVYVEASRGCPFQCEFCLSALDVPVRNVALAEFLAAMQSLLDRGLRQFKFVDRTFNLNLNFSRSILEFFLERYRPGLFLHFEMIPDRLPEPLRAVIARFPPGALQFEVGIQTFNDAVAARISRRQDNAKLEENLKFLREQTGVYVHADLIAGLPGEDLESFGKGFDRLVALGPQEIQVGLLKRLRGTPIIRHDQAWKMVYSPLPPYEIRQTSVLDAATMDRLRHFASFWDRIANSGNFLETARFIGRGGSKFEAFGALSDWLWTRFGRSHSISLDDLSRGLFDYLTGPGGCDAAAVAGALRGDYLRPGRRARDLPAFLRDGADEELAESASNEVVARRLPKRQARHLAGAQGESSVAGGLGG